MPWALREYARRYCMWHGIAWRGIPWRGHSTNLRSPLPIHRGDVLDCVHPGDCGSACCRIQCSWLIDRTYTATRAAGRGGVSGGLGCASADCTRRARASTMSVRPARASTGHTPQHFSAPIGARSASRGDRPRTGAGGPPTRLQPRAVRDKAVHRPVTCQRNLAPYISAPTGYCRQ